MRWIWDAAKNRANRQKHGLSFETAQLVFEDPLAVSRLDISAADERWLTMGVVGGLLMIVAHTWPESGPDNEAVGRIISARGATRHERKDYEEGNF